MQVEPIKLSDFDSTDTFIQRLIDDSTNPHQMNYFKQDGDCERIQKAMEIALELNEIATESNLSLWVCSHSGLPQVAVSMGAVFANMGIYYKDGDWMQMPIEWLERVKEEKTCK